MEVALQVLQPVLLRPDSVLVVAHREDHIVGFALAAPEQERSAEIHDLGVAPDEWGGALGERLIGRMCEELTSAGFGRACLWVYADNTRAVRLYERAGWTADPASARRHACSGRMEMRYDRLLGSILQERPAPGAFRPGPT